MSHSAEATVVLLRESLREANKRLREQDEKLRTVLDIVSTHASEIPYCHLCHMPVTCEPMRCSMCSDQMPCSEWCEDGDPNEVIYCSSIHHHADHSPCRLYAEEEKRHRKREVCRKWCHSCTEVCSKCATKCPVCEEDMCRRCVWKRCRAPECPRGLMCARCLLMTGYCDQCQPPEVVAVDQHVDLVVQEETKQTLLVQPLEPFPAEEKQPLEQIPEEEKQPTPKQLPVTIDLTLEPSTPPPPRVEPVMVLQDVSGDEVEVNERQRLRRSGRKRIKRPAYTGLYYY